MNFEWSRADTSCPSFGWRFIEAVLKELQPPHAFLDDLGPRLGPDRHVVIAAWGRLTLVDDALRLVFHLGFELGCSVILLVVANTGGSNTFRGSVLCYVDINRVGKIFKVAYSNMGKTGTRQAAITAGVICAGGGSSPSLQIASLPLVLAPWEVQLLTPAM